ncbi:MAG: GGDEF domain-containing protein [Alphaproteobacteria bacterium]|nr:GGDEF domain-containing protein [Hyphomonas sp.]MBR9808242.1 GGDEF domain-containing protein [Alphaproteobacteria bacterium]|tara:strand:- start:5416 stop:6099 length:684 start_codon:yes stop_codon:yes gene_type:complete
MADDLYSPQAHERRTLLDVLGVDLSSLDLRTRAALEALCDEVLVLRDDVDQLRDALDEAVSLADNDALCPVFNRRAFEREIRREIALAARFRTPLSLIYIDLDNFKQVNDAFGHAAGDEVLIRVSEILLRLTRETDIVGRLGGDEFGIVLAQATAEDSRRKAEQLSHEVDQLVVRRGGADSSPGIHIGASCGIVEWQAGQGAESLISAADQAMFAQKARRKSARRAT